MKIRTIFKKTCGFFDFVRRVVFKPVFAGVKKVKRILRKIFSIKSTRSLSGDFGNILFLTLMSIAMIIPILYVINNAFKPLDELFLYPPRFFVANPTLDNVKDLFSLMSTSWVPMSRYLFNTVFVTATGTFFHIIFASMAAYVLEKHDFYGRKIFFSIVVLTLMFSPTVTMIPNFVVMSQLRLVDTYWALILPAIGSSLGLFLMKQFMCNVHNSLLEAAKIDGAGEFTTFWKIVMPNVRSAWLTLMIFSVQALWNSTGGVLIRSEELKPLTYALNQVTAGGIARAGASAAVSLVVMSVPIFVFIISQSNILDTMATSGIKE
ncbi:MAG: carbohydrate ABC transporter permease [Oscillospiraceae bacterium]